MAKRFLISLAAAALLSTPAMAEEEESTTVEEDVEAAGSNVDEAATKVSSEARVHASYGPAGCGLGSVLFDPGSKITQILAATTNGTSGNQTFGITSGTSNCDDAEGGTESAKAFVQTNRVALAKDISRGQGETIESLAQLAGCQDSAAVGRRLQSNFDTIFPDSSVSDVQVSDNVVGVLSSDSTLQCQSLG